MRTLTALLALLMPLSTWGAEVRTRGYVSSDGRVSLPGKDAPPGKDALRFVRLDNTARMTARITSGGVQAHADLALVYRGIYNELAFSSMTRRDQSDPYSIESDALYLHVSDIGIDGLDLMLGRQIVQWGAADQFNPTSVLNPLDLEDPLKFGDRVANEMAILRYTAPWSVFKGGVTVFDEMTLTFAVVPTHRPGQLPASASTAFSDPDLFVQFVHAPLLKDFAETERTLLRHGADLQFDTHLKSPSTGLDNVQFAPRLSMTLLGVDTSVMYFRGFSDVIQPRRIGATLPDDIAGLIPMGFSFEDPDRLNSLLDMAALLLKDLPIGLNIELAYPKVDVVGFDFDFATSLDSLGGLGLWVEAAVTYHDDVVVVLDGGALGKLYLTDVEGGEFWKIAAGTDYSILSWWYINVQYLHGFVDEFGADNLNDYVIAGSDFKFFSDRLLLRVFGLVQLQDKSHVIFPQLTSTHWANTELSLGAFIMRGGETTKFGSPAAGQSKLFVTGKYSF